MYKVLGEASAGLLTDQISHCQSRISDDSQKSILLTQEVLNFLMMQIMSSSEEKLTNTLNIQKLVAVLVLITSGSNSGKEEVLSGGKLSGPCQMAVSQ